MFVRHSLLGITETLKALQVRPQYVTVGYEEKNNNLYVMIHKPTSKEILRVVFRASQFVHDQKYVEKELYKAALWYHGGSIPQHETWWQRQTTWERFIWFWAFGFALIVILSIVKHFGLYE